jgi:hypothetical protein
MIIVHTGSGSRPLTQWGPGTLSLGVERPGREADHPPRSSGITPLLLHCLHAVHRNDSTLSRSLSRFMSLFCSHSYFVLPFVFVSLVLTSFRSTSLSSISCAFIFLFNHTLSAYFLPLFFLASFLVICSFVFMSCTFPSVSGHSPLMQHCELTLPFH